MFEGAKETKQIGAGAAAISLAGIGHLFRALIHSMARNPQMAKKFFGQAILGVALRKASTIKVKSSRYPQQFKQTEQVLFGLRLPGHRSKALTSCRSSDARVAVSRTKGSEMTLHTRNKGRNSLLSPCLVLQEHPIDHTLQTQPKPVEQKTVSVPVKEKLYKQTQWKEASCQRMLRKDRKIHWSVVEAKAPGW